MHKSKAMAGMGALAAIALVMPAMAQTLAPLTLPVGDGELVLGGAAHGALLSASQPGSAVASSSKKSTYCPLAFLKAVLRAALAPISFSR